MSNALAIAAVTAVIKDMLDNALVDASLNSTLSTSVTVKALPPDLVEVNATTGPALNLYLYRVTPNIGWRNAMLPSRDGAGRRLTNAPLALDLHYLLSAYGTQDLEGEILLGYAMQQLHERPILTRDAIRTTLASPSPVGASILPPAFAALSAADLAEQVELIKVTPDVMTTEDLSKLWGAFQSNYRPSAAYVASVVLIESSQPRRAASPVLTIGEADRGPTVVPGLELPIPTLTAAVPPNRKPSAYLGEVVRLTGHHLAGDAATPHTIELAHPRLLDPLTIVAAPNDVADAEISFAISTPAADTPAGVYALTVVLTRDGKQVRTNAVPLVLAPRIDNVAVAGAGPARQFTVTVTPDVQPQQSVSFLVGSQAAPSSPILAPTDTVVVGFTGLTAGTFPVRLRVDGIDSVLVDYESTPPSYLASQQVTL
ncbi:MAG: DUF4255 domain-containing protein [Planctomycetes bacterium]|nr:DUF4255 domain-containing protein [Planctomycetota bacterium]